MRLPNPFYFVTSLWHQRELLWQFSHRYVEMRHRGSYLGIVWSLLNPLMMLALYVFVFGYVFKGSFLPAGQETRMDYALTVFLGLAIFQLFTEVLGVAPMSILGAPNLVKKVVFPLHVLPAAGVAASVFHMMISLALVLLGVGLFGGGLTLKVLWLPAILLPLVMLVLGVAWLLSAIGVFLRDFNQITGVISVSLMFASAIFYPVSAIPPAAWLVLRFNPLLQAVELAREVVIWNISPSLIRLVYIAVCGLVSCLMGHWAFRKMSPAFADVI